jgi:gamma-glutamylcyclotransferase (GGCT)/AIG2-like uncharacterized protein YtfP
MNDELKTDVPGKLVVYGTLMEGEANQHYLASAQLLGRDILANIVLYDLGPYPAAMFEVSDGIDVEVYEIDSATLASLEAPAGRCSSTSRSWSSIPISPGTTGSATSPPAGG